MSDLELLLTAWLTDVEIPADFKPSSNVEEILLDILNGIPSTVDPKSRADVLLNAISAKQPSGGGGGFEASVSYDDKTDPLLLTNNFYTICRTVMFGSTSANNSTTGQTSAGGLQGNSPVLGKLVDVSGANVPYINGSNGYQAMLTRYAFNGDQNNWTYTAIVTGTGTTAPAKTDYTLTDINREDTVLVPEKESLDDYSGTMIITATIGNTSDADRVINEIGVTSGVYDSGNWNSKKILIARTVLSSPVTLANGESKVFTIRVGLPTPE